MFRMSTGKLRVTLQQIRQATQDHLEWQENLIRTIVCRLPPDPDELSNDAHHRCDFGRWYYAEATADLRQMSVFAAMEGEHRRLHEVAARLLRTTANGGAVQREDYDELSVVNARLAIELGSLRHEIQDILRSSDPLTGAHGRVRLLPELREWRELARRDVQSCCIAFMDIDRLKDVNDTHGHAVGDQILAGAIRYVTEHLRPYDKVYRYGGDEFLVSLPGIEVSDALRLIERITAGFSSVPFVVAADGRPIHATASFGVAQLDPGICVEESIDRADKALLLAKSAGRDRAVAWDPTITTGTILRWSS